MLLWYFDLHEGPIEFPRFQTLFKLTPKRFLIATAVPTEIHKVDFPTDGQDRGEEGRQGSEFWFTDFPHFSEDCLYNC